MVILDSSKSFSVSGSLISPGPSIESVEPPANKTGSTWFLELSGLSLQVQLAGFLILSGLSLTTVSSGSKKTNEIIRLDRKVFSFYFVDIIYINR